MRFNPWINPEIIDQIKERDKLLNDWLKRKMMTSNLISAIDKPMRNRVTSMMMVSKSRYLKNFLTRTKGKQVRFGKE